MKKLISLFKKIFLGGEIIEKTQSVSNGEIVVIEELSGKKVMRVGGIVQSGGVVEKIWRKALSNIQYPVSRFDREARRVNIKSVLILGLGCGTVAEIINRKWPEAQITGIEIDKEVLEIGKKYFALEKIKNLSILNEDALWWITSKFALMDKQKYNLILVDLYKGKEFPEEATGEIFLKGLGDLAQKNGLIVINRLYFDGYKKITINFFEKLKNCFLKVKVIRVGFNWFFVCRYL